MNPRNMLGRWLIVQACALFGSTLCCQQEAFGQAGLRQSLERLDRNEDGTIDPDEITPLARPYLERVAESRRMSLDRPNRIDKWQEAARIYYALQNGVADKRVSPEGQSSIQEFGTLPGEPLVPEFGLAEVKYPYTQDDLDFADRTLRTHDDNGDGYISRREAEDEKWTHRNPFDDDLNEDDRLSRLELAQRYARRRLLEGMSDELGQRARRIGSGVEPSVRNDDDRRGDSQWWRRGGSRYYLTATILSRFDVNKNGRLELSEAAQLGIASGRIDANRDGEISRDELHVLLTEMQDSVEDLVDGLPGWFFELDANRDQQVAMAEFADDWTEEKILEFSSLDTNGDGLLTATEVTQSKAMVGGTYNNTNAEVLPPRKTIISEIEVSEDYLIGDLNVQLSITHSHTSYLDAYLTGPDGQRVELFTEVGGQDDHFDQTIFDDQSRYPITKARPPFKGTFLTEAALKRQPSLSQFNGTSIKGVWQLVIRGTRSERFGMLHSWGLIVRPQEEMPGGVEAAPIQDGPQPSAISASYRSPIQSPERSYREESSTDRWEEEKRAKAASEAKQIYYKSLESRGFNKGEGSDKNMSDDEREARMEARKKAFEKYKEFLESKKLEKGKKVSEPKR